MSCWSDFLTKNTIFELWMFHLYNIFLRSYCVSCKQTEMSYQIILYMTYLDFLSIYLLKYQYDTFIWTVYMIWGFHITWYLKKGSFLPYKVMLPSVWPRGFLATQEYFPNWSTSLVSILSTNWNSCMWVYFPRTRNH